MAATVATPEQVLERMWWLQRYLDQRRPGIQTANDYFRGKHPLKFMTPKWREAHAARYDGFSDNWCAPVASSPTERLAIDGFRLSDDPTPDGPEKSLWNDWLSNEMGAKASQGFLASIIGRRSFVTVWGDSDDNPVMSWERPEQVVVDYDPETGQPIGALKMWRDDLLEYATFYTAEAVWKWQRTAVQYGRTLTGLFLPPSPGLGGWETRQPKSDDTWPVPNPLGEVPVTEFPNRPLLGAEPLSDITGAMAMQDAINLLWAYLFNAADFASMPARVVMGQDEPKMPVLNDQGQIVGYRPADLKKLAEDRILYLTGQNTKIGQWEAANLDVFTGVVETAVAHLAAQTRTPPHYLLLGKGMVNVNADGMRAAETGLVKKVEEIQLGFSAPARRVFRQMALVRGDDALADQCRLGTVKWRNAENRSQAQLVDSILKLRTVGFPFEWLAEQYGLGQTEVTRVMAMRQAELDADPVGALSKQLGQGAGLPAGTPPGVTLVENNPVTGG